MGLFKRTPKILPDYWKTYENLFKDAKSKNFNELTFVVLDTETTGFSFEDDRILSIGAVKIKNETISVQEVFEIYLKQEKFNKDTVHVHGLLKNGNRKCISEILALEQFLDYVGNAIIVAHHAGFDIGMLNRALERHGLPKLKNTVLDTGIIYKKTLIKSYLLQPKSNYTLDELAEKFSISRKDRHTALGDAYITAIAFLKIISRLKEKKNFSLKYLLR
ncbi:3'-5' exonuclease [Maribacter hydrothermalis]|uniref:DNA polymerase III subunit epsilon n=1 Tax=Maribacter hydrothermalis TaxID=1836467 RepID=A0A1B7ZD56_9FLAO|nr:3'-5' exonuclease [Maribacter hydrothermalis]APQ18533.1 DNA polymerase III subunit epsilon [Maribacter hydrothermalis]OBR40912.1 DNA polymerase III subunit epsilon [Maribacter hydrothermalis]